jgi:hypothetical protein
MRAIIIGTGPSLTPEAIEQINASDMLKFGCNKVFEVIPNLTALLGCNHEFWTHYWDEVKSLPCDLWTSHPESKEGHPLRHIRGLWADGLSTDPEFIHYGHSSGYQLINLALHYGVTEFVLIGYDLKYPAGYNGHQRQAGGNRHFFGEYPKELQHWTRFNIGDNGELNGLLECYRTIKSDDYGIRIINCSPGSALDFFETGELGEFC